MGLDDELEGKVNVVPFNNVLEGTLLKVTTFTFPSTAVQVRHLDPNKHQELSKI